MKHRGPAHSLNPARMAAREHARVAARAEAASGAAAAAATRATIAAAATSSPPGWRFTTDEQGRLVAHHLDSDTRVVIATPDERRST